MNSDDLTAAERAQFTELAQDIEPRPELEDAVVAALAGRGLLRDVPPRSTRGVPRRFVAFAAAACLASLTLGVGLGRSTAPASAQIPLGELPRASFVLLLHAGAEFDPFTEANFDERFGDYNQWIASVRASEHFITGEQLDGTGRLVVPDGGAPRVVERAAASSDGDLLGMFLIRAADYEEATAIALSLPHVRYGGRVSVRRVEPV